MASDPTLAARAPGPPTPPLPGRAEGAAGTLVHRHALATRLWHWLNVVTLAVLLMSGLMIFNAHPRLYWGSYGANTDSAWLEIGATASEGRLRIGGTEIGTTGVLGRWTDADGNQQTRAFPGWATIPSGYDLAMARRWHLFFAWPFAFGLLAFMTASLLNRHFRRDLRLRAAEVAPRNIWADIRAHLRLRFHDPARPRDYNVLQKLSYVVVLFVLLPAMILTGLTMSPGMNAAWPWLLDLFGGRQSARSIHFLSAAGLVGFTVVHVALVILAGPVNELRSMVTGWWKVPRA